MDKKRIKYVCPNCGSDYVFSDASAIWNTDSQQWELYVIYDNSYCEGCNTEIKYFDKVELEQE